MKNLSQGLAEASALRGYGLSFLKLAGEPDEFEILNACLRSIRTSLAQNRPNLEAIHDVTLICQQLLPTLVSDLNSEQLMALLVTFSTSARPVFVTGNAGTGKSHLLRSIDQFARSVGWNVAVVAPTGIAAINVGGMTIHRLFRLHTHRVLAEKEGSAATNHGFPVGGFQKGHEPLLRKIELLIVDELSMVRADVLDAMDRKLRHARRIDRPFGGVRVLFFGDLLQLPPVQDQAWKANARRLGYGSPYAVGAKVFHETSARLVELHQNVRVSNGLLDKDSDDAKYVDILGRIRKLQVSDEDLQFLNTNCFVETGRKGNLQIYARNAEVDRENDNQLERLPSTLWERTATLEGRFAEYQKDQKYEAFPADLTLRLKIGARVMFIKNDDQNEHPKWANGSLGTVKGFSPDGVLISLDSGLDVKAGRSRWDMIKYDVFEFKGSDGHLHSFVEPRVEGSFVQYPLRLAWAVTIHKSQGQTFDNITVDLGAGVWEPGQAYVALSRVTSLKGLELLRPLKSTDFIALDSEVNTYLHQQALSFNTRELEDSKRRVVSGAEKHYSSLAPIERDAISVIGIIDNHSKVLAQTSGLSMPTLRFIMEGDSEVIRVRQMLGEFLDLSKSDYENLLSALEDFQQLCERRHVVLQATYSLVKDEPETTIISEVFESVFPNATEPITLISKLNRAKLTGTELEHLTYPERRARLLSLFHSKDSSAILLLAECYLWH